MSQRVAIVNAASVNSHFSLACSIPYTASKHAVMGITKTVRLTSPITLLLSPTKPFLQAALEAREHNIRVNALSLGFLLTDLTRPLADEPGGALADKWNSLEKRQGRSAKAEEVGDVAVLITSPGMGLVNGVNLFVDG
jgi:NAD(P)-dependent dehydrogenase (short-subunit alcohol dehydrogenase family)